MNSSLHNLICTARRVVHRDALFATLVFAMAFVPAVLLVAWLISGLHLWPAPSVVPLVIEAFAGVFAGLVAWFGVRRWVRSVTDEQVAAAAERSFGLPEGDVRGVLELSRNQPAGCSDSLIRRAEQQALSRLGTVPADALSGALGVSVRRRKRNAFAVLGALSVLVIAAGFMAPTRSRASWAPLLHPVAHLSPPPLPAIQLRPGNIEVARGSSLDVHVVAPMRDAVLLQWRAAGDVLREESIALTDAAGSATIVRVDAPVKYWVRGPDGAVTDTFRITPIDPLLVSELTVEVIYPAYLERPAERFDGEVPSLEIPQGAELRIHGRMTRPLSRAALERDSTGAVVELKVDGDAFSGRWIPRNSGTYAWHFRSASDAAPELAPPAFELTVLADQAPTVDISYPGTDTVLNAEMMQSIIASASDDYGLRNATLVSWRTSSLGQRDPAVEQPVTLEGDEQRAIARALLDATSRGLLPGDTLSYFIRVTDNSPARQSGVSPTYKLRIPGMEELREQARRDAEDLVQDAQNLSRTANELQTSTRDLQRKSVDARSGNRGGQGGSPGGDPGQRQLDFQNMQQAKSVLERHEQMLGQIDDMKKRVDALQRAMAAAGLQDPELQKRLQELRELYQQALTPELKQKLEQLRQGIDQLDPEQVQRALEQLSQQQDAMKQQLERSLEMMRRAAAEQEMNRLSEEAKQLSKQQEALAEDMKRGQGNPAEQAKQQKELSERTESLNNALSALQKLLQQQGEESAAQKTGEAQERAGEAQKQMSQAAQQAQRDQGQQAAQNGEQAAQKLGETAKTLEQARQQMAEGWKKEVQEAMDKATNDALSLAQQQNELLEKMKQQEQGDQRQQPGGMQLPRPPQLPKPQMQAGKQQQQQSGQQQSGQQQSGQQQSGQQQSGQQQSGQQQSGQQQGGKQQGGQQQGGQQQGGQQQGGQQQGGQQQGGQQQGGQQQGGQQQGGQQQGGQQQGGQQGGQQQGGQQQGGQQNGEPGASGEQPSIRAQQQALKQGLEQLGRNLSEAGQRSAMLNRDVGAALGRANLSMEQTMRAMEQNPDHMPTQEAAQTLDALNRLALELLKNNQEIQNSQAGTGLQQALEQLADLAKQQGSVNSQASALAPMNLAPQTMAQQMSQLARQQREIASKLDGMNNMGGKEDVLGRLDELAREANQIAREMEGGRLTPQTMARQERLFHRLLDAGRTLEREDYSDERQAERPGSVGASRAGALDPKLLEAVERYPAPTPEQLRELPPAVRRLVLEYFEKLNRPEMPSKEKR